MSQNCLALVKKTTLLRNGLGLQSYRQCLVFRAPVENYPALSFSWQQTQELDRVRWKDPHQARVLLHVG